MDLSVSLSLTFHCATSDPPRLCSVLNAGAVPPLVKGPRYCASLPQRGSASGPTSVGGGSPSRMFGQPALMLATPTNSAASLIDWNTNGEPFSFWRDPS